MGHMENEALEILKELLEDKYGDLNNDCGCYVGGQWLSVKRIVDLINQADEEC